jgi:soluble lytic murein transglycosylase-like protein
MIWPIIALIGGIGLFGATRKKKKSPLFPTISVHNPPLYIFNALKNAAARYGVPLGIMKGVAHTESRYSPTATSRVGAKGLMQLMPVVIRTYGISDPFSPSQSAMGGARFLSKMYRKYGNWPQALAAYNWGPGNVDDRPAMKQWPRATQAYVKNVMGKAAA